VWIEPALFERLSKLAQRKCLSVTRLAHLYLEMAVNYEERMRAEDTRVARELEAILVRAIWRNAQGGEDTTDPTAPEG
jgi:hypothetical protein